MYIYICTQYDTKYICIYKKKTLDTKITMQCFSVLTISLEDAWGELDAQQAQQNYDHRCHLWE